MSREYTPEQKARVNAAINQALGRTSPQRTKPTKRQMEAALGVLMWLSEITEDAGERDQIGLVRHLLSEEADR